MRAFLTIGVLTACAGCAPTAISPMMMRLAPGNPDELSERIGLQSGPRLTTPLAASSRAGSFTFAGDTNTFSVPQWGLAYNLGLTKAITPATSLHLGAQGEFYYPFPLPAYGLYAGVSHYLRFGRASLAPAAIARFATDFGISSTGGPGALAGGELSLTLGWQPEDHVTVGLAPFTSYQHLWSGATGSQALYVGAALVARLELNGGIYEISGGFGRVFMPSTPGWSVPIFGVSTGR